MKVEIEIKYKRNFTFKKSDNDVMVPRTGIILDF